MLVVHSKEMETHLLYLQIPKKGEKKWKHYSVTSLKMCLWKDNFVAVYTYYKQNFGRLFAYVQAQFEP